MAKKVLTPEEKAAKEEAKKATANAEAEAKAAQEEKEKAEQGAAENAALEAKEKAEHEAAEKAALEAKAKAEAEAKAKQAAKTADTTKERLAEEAKRHFKNYPSCKVIYATGDNNFWLEENAGLARSHAGAHKLQLYEFKR